MRNRTEMSGRGGDALPPVAPALSVLCLVLLLPTAALALDPPDTVKVLLVSNGHHRQEDDIRDRLSDYGMEVTVSKASKVKDRTDLSPYDLIVITEFSHNISWKGLRNIEESGVPVLIVEHGSFDYSYDLGLVTTRDSQYVSTDTIEAVKEGVDDISRYVSNEALVHQPGDTVYGVSMEDVAEGVEALYYSSRYFDEVAILYDRERRIMATGVKD